MFLWTLFPCLNVAFDFFLICGPLFVSQRDLESCFNESRKFRSLKKDDLVIFFGFRCCFFVDFGLLFSVLGLSCTACDLRWTAVLGLYIPSLGCRALCAICGGLLSLDCIFRPWIVAHWVRSAEVFRPWVVTRPWVGL